MSALLAIITLLPIMAITGMCFYVQWQAMQLMKSTPEISALAMMLVLSHLKGVANG